jgi:monoamine oxidase
VSVLGAGTTTDFLPVLTRPFGCVHWAGTETAPFWNGYMDGAVRSGERAAKEVLAG